MGKEIFRWSKMNGERMDNKKVFQKQKQGLKKWPVWMLVHLYCNVETLCYEVINLNFK